MAQTLASLWLIIGFAERTAVFIATSWILISIALVTWGNASMLIRRAGERSLLDRMRDHDLDLCANDCSKSTGFQTRRDLEMARSCNFTRGVGWVRLQQAINFDGLRSSSVTNNPCNHW